MVRLFKPLSVLAKLVVLRVSFVIMLGEILVSALREKSVYRVVMSDLEYNTALHAFFEHSVGFQMLVNCIPGIYVVKSVLGKPIEKSNIKLVIGRSCVSAVLCSSRTVRNVGTRLGVAYVA